MVLESGERLRMPHDPLGPDLDTGSLPLPEPARVQWYLSERIATNKIWRSGRYTTWQQAPNGATEPVRFAVARIEHVPGELLASYLPDGKNPGPQDVFVFVQEEDWSVGEAVAAADRALVLTLPLGVLFVALVAWFVTGRALRPVEAIRAQLADITDRQLDRRVPVPDSGDEITRLAETTNATLDRLEETVQRQRAFVADAAHELRTPLAGLRNGIEVALAHPAQADWPQVAAASLQSTKRLQGLMDDLLLLARLDRGFSLPEQTVDLVALVEEQVTECGYLHPQGPRFMAETSGPALVTGNDSQLARVLRNMLDNAARYASSTVTVTVRDDISGQVIVEVVDDGPGIPQTAREYVFERFVRLDDSRSRDTGGAGLGLAIARDIAVRHGGSLSIADSTVGARFVLCLPRATTTDKPTTADKSRVG